MKKFWAMKVNAANPKVGELYLYGDISSYTWYGDEITPKQFKDDLDALGDVDEIHVYINSNGGDVFAGHAIHSMLKMHKATVTVYVVGLAASIASVIAMAGDRVVMMRNSMMMIHRAWTVAMGNANDMRKMGDDLERIDESLVAAYESKTGLPKDEIRALMDAETWLTADECVEKGFADEIEAEKKVAASLRGDVLAVNGMQFDLSRYNKRPAVAKVEEPASDPGAELTCPHCNKKAEVVYTDGDGTKCATCHGLIAEPAASTATDSQTLTPMNWGEAAKFFADMGGAMKEFMSTTTETLKNLTEAIASMRVALSVASNTTETPAGSTQEPADTQPAKDAGDEPLLVIGEEPLLVIEDAPSEEVTIEAETLQQAIKAAVDEGMKEFRFKMTGRVD